MAWSYVGGRLPASRGDERLLLLGIQPQRLGQVFDRAWPRRTAITAFERTDRLHADTRTFSESLLRHVGGGPVAAQERAERRFQTHLRCHCIHPLLPWKHHCRSSVGLLSVDVQLWRSFNCLCKGPLV